MNLSEINPDQVMLLGDPHEMIEHILARARLFRMLQPGEETLYIIACGDMEFHLYNWDWWADPLSERLTELNVVMLSIDGNHEDHKVLRKLQAKYGCVPIEMKPNIYWLPRGYRWEWHGHKWLACGGAASIHMEKDPIEQISDEQEEMIKAGGTTDVIVTHDCPSGVILSGLSDRWPVDRILVSELHRERLQRIFDVVEPKKMFGGHFHFAVNKTVEMCYGPCEITILDWCGGWQINSVIVDTRTLEILHAQ